MAFRFALAPVLRLRRSVERQRALQLQQANLKVASAQEAVAQLDRALSDSARANADALSIGRTAAELQFTSVLRDNLQHFRDEAQAEVRKLELLRQKALGEYHQAFRDREVLETLRARDRRTYQQEQLRRQQRALDDAYLLQRWRRRN